MPDDINWGALMQAQPGPREVGKAAVSTTGGTLGDPAGELQQYQTGALNQQLLKSKIAEQNIENQSSQLDLNTKQQTIQDAATLRAANDKGLQQFLDVGTKINGPLWRVAKEEALAATHKVFNDASDNDGLELGKIADASHAQQQFATQQALQKAGVQQDPKSGKQFMINPKTNQPMPVPQPLLDKASQYGVAAGQQMYQHMTGRLAPDLQQSLKDQHLDQWDEGTNAFLHHEATAILADKLEEKNTKTDDDTPLMKNTKFIDGLNKAAKAGDTDAQQTLTVAEQLAGKSKSEQTPDEKLQYTTQAAINTGKHKPLNDLQDANNRVIVMRDESENLIDTFKNMPKDYNGPLSGYFVGKLASDGQRIQKFLSELTPANMGVLLKGMGSAARTQFMQEMIKTAAGGLEINRDAALTVANNFHEKAVEGLDNNWKQEDQIRAQGVPAQYKAWKDSHPMPSTQKENTFIDPSIPMGAIGTDNQGNKVKYVGGKKDDPNSWEKVGK